MELNTTSILAVILFSAVALVTDLRHRRIPNWLTVSAALSGLAWQTYVSGMPGALTSLAGFATGFGFLLLLWLIGSGGGGDVKMMGAVGAWLGALPTLAVFIVSSGFAVVCAIGLIIWSRTQGSGPQSVAVGTGSDDLAGGGGENGPGPEQESALRTTVPYALPVALSVWTLLLFHAVR